MTERRISLNTSGADPRHMTPMNRNLRVALPGPLKIQGRLERLMAQNYKNTIKSEFKIKKREILDEQNELILKFSAQRLIPKLPIKEVERMEKGVEM